MSDETSYGSAAPGGLKPTAAAGAGPRAARQRVPAGDGGASPAATAGKSLRRGLLVLGLFIVATVAFTWPVSRHLTTAIPGIGRDSFLNTWTMVWEARALLRLDFANLFNGNLVHPNKGTILFSENLIGWQPVVLPVYALSRNPALAYNVAFLLSFVLTGFATYLLVRGLTGSTAAGVVAGLAFAFGPFRMFHVIHLQILSAQWTPLALWCGHRFFERRRLPMTHFVGSSSSATSGRSLGWALGMGAAFAMQMLSCLYLGVFLAVLMVGFVVYYLVTTGQVASGRTWLGLALAGVVAAAGSGWLYLLYNQSRRQTSVYRSMSEMTTFSSTLRDYLTPSERARLWSLVGHDKWQNEWIGVAAPALAAVGVLAGILSLFTGRRKGRNVASPPSEAASPSPPRGDPSGTGRSEGRGFSPSAQPVPAGLPGRERVSAAGVPRATALHRLCDIGFYVLVIPAAMVLSFGPTMRLRPDVLTGPPGPFRYLVRYVPGFRGIRAPHRFSMYVALAVAVLAGYGVAAVLGRLRGRRARAAFLLAAALLLLVDVAPLPLEITRLPMDQETRALCRWLQGLPGAAVIADVPWPGVAPDAKWREGRYLCQAMFHDRPTVNGGTREPRTYNITADAIARFPHDDAIRTLEGAGVTHVVVHTGREWGWGLNEADVNDPRLQLVQRFGGAVVYQLAPPAEREAIPPPVVASPAPPGITLFIAVRVPWWWTTSFGLDPGDWHVTWTPSGGAPLPKVVVRPAARRSGPIYLMARIRTPDQAGSYVLRVRDSQERFDHTVPVEVSEQARMEALAPPPRARLTAEVPARLTAGEERHILVRVENVGPATWPCRREPEKGRPDHDVRLGWYLRDAEGRTVTSGRRMFRADLAPGQAAELGILLYVPGWPGRYTLTIDPIVEHRGWFASLGSEPLVRTVEVD